MLSLITASPAFAPAVTPINTPSVQRGASPVMETAADLEVLAKKLNPIVGFYDPLALSAGPYQALTEEQAIGWLRHAEIKHGRVAMAAFVGFIVGSNGIHFPWNLQSDLPYATIAEIPAPAAQWDALPSSAKVQILLFIGLLEFLGEKAEPHYMSGGVPGKYPKFSDVGVPHFALDLFDPFGLSKNASPEKKSRGLLTEINNGRLAMLGIMAFVSEAKIPGSVPALAGKIAPYDGEVMAPFSSVDASMPFVSDMLNYKLHFGGPI